MSNSNPLLRLLETHARLAGDERAAIERATTERMRRLGPREDLFREGDQPDQATLVLSGWACRYKMLEDGRRQIVAFLLPGDFCNDHHGFALREMDHSVATITEATVADLARPVFAAAPFDRPRIAAALQRQTLVAASIQREWIVSLGQRDAVERIGHLFCELYLRLASIGLAHGGACEIPLTQADIAETTGLSAVHVNRSLQELRAANLISFRNRVLTVPHFEALQAASLFNPNYLHLDRAGPPSDAKEG